MEAAMRPVGSITVTTLVSTESREVDRDQVTRPRGADGGMATTQPDDEDVIRDDADVDGRAAGRSTSDNQLPPQLPATQHQVT